MTGSGTVAVEVRPPRRLARGTAPDGSPVSTHKDDSSY